MEQSEQRGVFSEHFLDIHIYMTSALKKEDIKALGLQLALELIHGKKEKDLITGLKTRTNPGRPDWDKVRFPMRTPSKGDFSTDVTVCCTFATLTKFPYSPVLVWHYIPMFCA